MLPKKKKTENVQEYKASIKLAWNVLALNLVHFWKPKSHFCLPVLPVLIDLFFLCTPSYLDIWVFRKIDKIGKMAYWHQRLYYMKKIQWQNVPLGGNRTQAASDTFAYKTETLGSLYSHALLILLKSSKSKYQVVHEQKFKDLLSSTCQVCVERIVLDLESEADWVLFPPGG